MVKKRYLTFRSVHYTVHAVQNGMMAVVLDVSRVKCCQSTHLTLQKELPGGHIWLTVRWPGVQLSAENHKNM